MCDSKLRIPPGSQIVKSAEKYRTIVAYAEQKNAKEKIKILHTMGVETIYCPDEKNQIDLKKLMNFINREDPKAFVTIYNVSSMQYQPKI